jgi:hypothetical protein
MQTSMNTLKHNIRVPIIYTHTKINIFSKDWTRASILTVSALMRNKNEYTWDHDLVRTLIGLIVSCQIK